MIIRDKQIYLLAIMMAVYVGLTVYFYNAEQYIAAIGLATVIGGTASGILNRYFLLKFRRETELVKEEFIKLRKVKEEFIKLRKDIDG